MLGLTRELQSFLYSELGRERVRFQRISFFGANGSGVPERILSALKIDFPFRETRE